MSYNKAYEPVRGDVAQSDYELIDSDPYYTRVISYFRASDIAVWGASTAAFPIGLVAWEKLEPVAGAFKNLVRYLLQL